MDEHAAHALAAGEHAGLLLGLFPRKEHAAQEAAQISFVLLLGILPQPVHQAQIHAVEIGVVVLGEVGVGDGHAPFARACVRLDLARQNVEQQRAGTLVLAHEGDLVALGHGEGDVVQRRSFTVLGNALHHEDVVAGFAVGLELDERIFAGRGLDVGQLDLIEQFFAAGRLLGFGSVGREARNEVLAAP